MSNILKKDKTSKLLYVLIILFFITAIGYLGVRGYAYITDNDLFNTKKEEKIVEIQATELNNDVKEGVYITDVSDVVDNAMPSIVSITSKTLIQSGYYGFYFGNSNREQYQEGAGSGIIIDYNNTNIMILTNNHVVADAKELTIKFIDETEADAQIVGASERKDIAIVSVKVSDLSKTTLEKIKVATLGDSNDLKVGNGVIAIGNALGYGQSVTTGVVSALNREIQTDDYSSKMIQIDAAINGGNSGGALLNSKGEVVGVNSAKYSSNGNSTQASIEGMGFAIPISDVKELIKTLMEGKEDTSGMTLGIEGYMTNSGYIQGYNLPSGFYISKITSGGNADKSELEIGNIITEVDGKKVDSVNDISNVLYEKKSGDTVKLKVKYISGREYKDKEITINLS